MSDLISRQAAITITITPKEDREYQTHNLDDAYEQAWEDLQKRIEQLPSAQPEHGRWEAKWNTLFKAYLPYCSACSKCAVYTFDYCPNCGAKMDGESYE